MYEREAKLFFSIKFHVMYCGTRFLVGSGCVLLGTPVQADEYIRLIIIPFNKRINEAVSLNIGLATIIS